MVFVHGFPMDRRIWVKQLAGFSDKHRVLTIDLKGFGKSRSTEAFTIDSMADDLVAFIHAVAAGPCLLAGLSMGGYVALSVAIRHAEVLRGLVMVSSKSQADTPQGKEGRQKMVELAEQQGSKAVADQMLPRVLGDLTLRDRPELVQELRNIMEQCSPRTIANATLAMRDRVDRTGDLPSLRMPVLVVLGENDHLIPLADGQQMARTCRRGAFISIPNTGHMAPMEDPTLVNKAIAEFAGRL